ncbi:MAG: hypothetical protein LBO78_00910 [Rickettsiales bacterium]|jgi:hypothetical protein|nr:hypothetical protein [Rickettsiales bacterium]
MGLDKAFTGKVLASFSLALGLFSASANAEGTPIYYDTFYNDYYQSFPDAKPKARAAASAGGTIAPYQQQYAGNAGADANSPQFHSYYNGSVEHPLNKWDIDVKYKYGIGQFYFEMLVGSVLNWDEITTTETLFTVSRDFMYKNRHFVATATFGTGSGTTSRTSDDDVYNELHVFSLGRGSVDLSTYSIALGLRNMYRFAGFDLTPFIGYKKRHQGFEMADHTRPSPFFMEKECIYDDATGGCQDIQLSSVSVDGVALGINDIYILNSDGSKSKTTDSGYLTIPGDQLGYGMQIIGADVCWYALDNTNVCLKSGIEDYGGSPLNLIAAFGGASQADFLEGTTHIYPVDWTGPFVAANLERAISPKETFNIYAELFFPTYRAEGTWPGRDELQQYPSFVDEGGSSIGLQLDMTYKYKIYPNVDLSIGGSFEYYRVQDADTTTYYVDYDPEFSSGEIKMGRWRNLSLLLGLSFKL